LRPPTSKNKNNAYSPKTSNLLPCYWNLIEQHKANDEYIIIQANKNLGGCILLQDTYITRGITEHLSDSSVYQRLSKSEAIILQNKLQNTVTNFTCKWRARQVLSKAETVYLQRGVKRKPGQFAHFCMSLKAHKNPWKMWPIVCLSGTFVNNLSCWLDYQLQKLIHLLPTYIKDSNMGHGEQGWLGQFFCWNHDGAKLRLNLGQLLDQCLGVCWHHWVQAIVFILNLDIRIAHQEATHGKRGHWNVPAFNLWWAVFLVFEARETWSEVAKLFHTCVERLDGQTLWLLERHVHVICVLLCRVLVTHS